MILRSTQNPVSTASARRVWLAAFFVAVAGFALLSVDFLVEGPLSGMDAAISHWIFTHHSAFSTAAMQVITQVNGTLGTQCMLAATVLLLAVRRHVRTGILLVLYVEGALLLNVALKLAFARDRPALDEPLVHLSTFSFPSGHALAATVWWGGIGLLLCRMDGSKWRPGTAVAVAALLIVLTCVSRVYLGAHYLTDVLAGVCEGLAWLSLWALMPRAFSTVAPTPRLDR